jgi:glycosyltransferase involved in cell wall biosynthesis
MTAPGHPAVTVVIPCFNQAQFLPDAIASVRRQSHAAVECVVVNDGSSDETPIVAKQLGVTLIQQLRRGVSVARNTGLAAARSDFVVFLDADDVLLSDALAHGTAALQADLTAAAVVGRCRGMSAAGEALAVRHPDIDPSDLYNEWLSQNFVWTPGAAMFRRDALLEIGGFPAGLGPAADYAVYLRLARDGRVRFIAQELVCYRQHDASMSTDPARMLRATLAVLRMERRDASPPRRRIRRGRRQWCDFYGDQILQRLRIDWRSRRFGRWQLRALMTLMQHCPRIMLRHAARKGRLVVSALRRHLMAPWLAVVSRRSRVVP